MSHVLNAPGSIRRLTEADEPLFEAHLLRLDAASRRNRFGGAVSEDFLRDYARRAFALDGVMLGYVEDGALRAAGELRILTDDVDREAEAAFSVEPDWRRRGIASGLFARIIDAARNRTVRRILVVCLPGNTAMQGLTKKFDGSIVRLTPDVIGVVPSPRPTWFSRWREAAGDAAGFAAAMFDLSRGWISRDPVAEKSPPASAPDSGGRKDQRDKVSGAPERASTPPPPAAGTRATTAPAE